MSPQDRQIQLFTTTRASVALLEEGFSFKTGLFSKDLATVDRLQGRHTEDDAFLYLKGAEDLDEFTHLESALLALRTQYGGIKL